MSDLSPRLACHLQSSSVQLLSIVIRCGLTNMNEQQLLERIVVNPQIFGGKPIIRGMRIAVEHVLGMLAAGDTPEMILKEYSFLEREDIQACLLFAHRVLSGEHVYDRMPLTKSA
ncbi:MAG: hypothetical protein Nkreftii_000857 [Candidatus Nitrospira kreftii]|uniref:DUF433 domain-containing protein n=1 Tax=Candidatus Nitrospira kreftii TaxID=2652173 RepID=A0A7S8FC19_9BACT|nr:MAG: hypothetical protein Nkreftii_000857 [Candidatus Nitrospira kreftii]